MAASAKEPVKEEEDSPENAFSFTRLLTNGDCWQGILEGHAPAAVSSEIQTTIPVVLPQSSELAVNPPTAEQDLVSTPPSTVDKSRKRRPTRDLSCITASQQTKDTEGGEEKPSKKQKRAARDRKQKEQSTSENTETTGSKPGKENSKPTTDAPKQDYIHVRARRGQATDSHSLAERVRREKISARMKKLQDLVPGCNKVTGKAMMLDEIINYVQSLQRQVEFLSMKLAAVKPALSLYTDTYLTNEAPALGGVHEMNCFNELLHDSEEAQWQTATGASVQLLSS